MTRNKLAFLAYFAFSLVGLQLSASVANASIVIIPGLRYQSTKASDANGVMPSADSQVMAGDGRIGIALDTAGIYLGGLYRYENTVSGDDKMTGTGYGASAGIISRQFALIGTYFLDGERTYNTNTERKLTGGSGYQVDVMYVAGVTETFGIGPQLTYRNQKFSKSQAGGGAEVETKYEEKTIDPGVVLWWRF